MFVSIRAPTQTSGKHHRQAPNATRTVLVKNTFAKPPNATRTMQPPQRTLFASDGGKPGGSGRSSVGGRPRVGGVQRPTANMAMAM